MLFKKKIVFTEGMNETLCSFDEIPWFSCCGVPYDKPSYYPYLQEKDPKRAEKLLLHTKNYSGTVCLTNLFKEGICRADTFILQTAGWKFYQNEFMPCVEASWRTYEKRALKANGLDLNSVEKRFLRDYGFPDSIDLQLCRMVQYLLVEQYFLERFPQFPLFFSRIIDIYKDGHIVLGWSGRFASHETNLENENGVPILPTDGSLIIWYNPVEQKVIKDWDEHLVVIASDAGDPYCLDLRRNDTAVFWAEHGAGTWDFQPAFDCLEDFLESVLDVPKTQEYETAYPYHYIRLIVTGISDTKKALVFLKQHFGDSSFQQTKDRLKELPLLIYSGLDTGTAPLENSLDRWGLMYEKQQISLEKFLEDQAYIRNL